MWSEPEPSTHWDRLLSGSRQVSSEQSGVMGGGSGGPSYTPSSLIELCSVKENCNLWRLDIDEEIYLITCWGYIFLPLFIVQSRFVLLLPWALRESHSHRSYTDFQKFLGKWKLSVFYLYLDKVVRPCWYKDPSHIGNKLNKGGGLLRITLRPSSWKIHQALNEIWSFLHFHIKQILLWLFGEMK